LSLSNGCAKPVSHECARRARQRRDEVDQRVVLAAQCERAELLAAQARERLASKQPVVLPELAVLHVVAVFEHEDRLQAAAEILAAAQAETAAVDVAARRLHQRALRAALLDVVGVHHAGIDEAVQRDRTLRLRRCGGGKPCKRRECGGNLFHVKLLRSWNGVMNSDAEYKNADLENECARPGAVLYGIRNNR
jgi:hypothetical protein